VTTDDEMRDGVRDVRTPDEATRERTQAAFASLQAVMTGLVRGMEARMDERCPYRAHEDRCTFAGGCANQRRESRDGARMVWCTGDHHLRRTKP
jgi:ribosome modulation factor